MAGTPLAGTPAAAAWPIRIEVPGPPVPWARARRRGRRYYTAPEVTTHRDAIRDAWIAAGRPCVTAEDPLSLSLTFYLARPGSHYRTGRNAHRLRDGAPRFATGKPDIDNLQKLVLDALNGLLYRDDAQVICVAAAGKHWAGGHDPPRTVIRAWVPTTSLLRIP